MFLSHVDDDYLLLYPAHPGCIHVLGGPKHEVPLFRKSGESTDSSDESSQSSEENDSDTGNSDVCSGSEDSSKEGVYTEEFLSDEEGEDSDSYESDDSTSIPRLR